MTKEELQEVLKKHSLWLNGMEGGVRANLSGADLSRARLSGVNLSGVNLSRANLSEVVLSGASLFGAILSEANLSRADLSGAILSEANLSRADLSGANLSEANLSKADLSGANLFRAVLFRANLSGTIYENNAKIEFTYQQHTASYFGLDEIKIGCKVHSIKYWLDNFETIGKEAGYTLKQIEKYGEFIKNCAADFERSEK